MVSGNPQDREFLRDKVRKSIKIVQAEALKIVEILIDDPNKRELARQHIVGAASRQIKYMNRQLNNYSVEYRPIKVEEFLNDKNI